MKINSTEALAKIKQLFNQLTAPPVHVDNSGMPQVINEKLKDGTAITIDKMESGGLVMIGTNPAPVGELELMNGTKLVISDNGIIAEIIPVQGAPAPPTDITVEDAQAAFQRFATGTPEERLVSLETVTKALFSNVFGWQLREEAEKAMLAAAKSAYVSLAADKENPFAQKFAEIETVRDKQNELIKSLIGLVEHLSKQPIGRADSAASRSNAFAGNETEEEDEEKEHNRAGIIVTAKK